MKKSSFQSSLFLLLTFFTLIGCNDIEYIPSSSSSSTTTVVVDGNVTTVTIVSGAFIDDYVQGLEYTCSSSSESNLTTSEGNFSCKVDDNVTFYLANQAFGTIKAENKVVTPYSFFDANITAALNLARLLQSIDDNSSSGKIVIDKSLEALLPSDLNYSSPTFESDVESGLGRALVAIDTAHQAMNEALTLAGVEIPASAIIVDTNTTESNTTTETNTTIEPNVAPIITTPATLSIHENQTEAFTINATDENNDTLNYSLSGVDSSYFNVDAGSGIVTFKTAADYESKNSYSLTLVVNDSILSDTQDVTIYLINTQEKPMLQNTLLSIDENQPIGSSVGGVEILSHGDENITSFLLSGSGSENFTINSVGLITTQSVLDTESVSSYLLQAKAINSIGESSEVNVTIDVSNLADITPTLVNTTLSLLENATLASEVGKLTISNAGDSPITAILLSGTGSSNFTISNDAVVRVSANATLDYETTQEYTLSAVATNGSGNSNSATLKIYINNVIDTVPTLVASSASIDENATAQTHIVDINVSDAGDSNGTFILSGDGSDKFVVSSDGNISLKSSSSLDYESVSSYTLLAKKVNMAGVSNSVNIVIDVNDVPEVALLQSTLLSVTENKIAGDRVGTIEILYGGDSAISDINLSGVGSENFVVDNNGVVTLTPDASLDYETTPKYTLSAVATNSAGESASVDVNISVLDYAFTPFQIAKLEADDREVGDMLGASVSVSGEYIVVGAPYEDSDGILSCGSAYLFKRSASGDVTQIAKLKADDAQTNDNFGTSVSMSGNIVVVGAPNEDENGENAGSVYIFELDENETISQLDKVAASNPHDGDNFGVSLSIDGDYMVVGADKEDTTSDNSGSAYAFKLENGLANQLAVVKSTDSQYNEGFGSSVSINNKLFVVGAPKRDGDAEESGAVYLFKIDTNDGVSRVATLSADDAEDSDNFGFSVSIYGSYIGVGAYKEDSGASNGGSAYLYKIGSNNTLSQIEKISLSNAQQGDYFGSSIAVSQNYVAVGAYGKDSDEVDSGSAYIYRINPDDSLSSVSTIQANDTSSNAMFANAIAMDGNLIAVGAFNSTDGGGAYLYDGEPVDKIYIYNQNDTNRVLNEGVVSTLFTIEAQTPYGEISYSLGGNDADNFVLEGATIANAEALDYENALDIGSNNSYDFVVTLSDNADAQQTLNLSVNVKDRYYLEVAKLHAWDAQVDDRFGEVVAMSGEYIVIGAPYEDESGANAGSVYIFKKNSDNSLTQIAKIQSDDVANDDFFGHSVAIDGDYIVVGAYKNDSSASNAGSVYLFKIGSDETISQVAKLTAHDAEAEDIFGDVVAISGNYIVVGSHNESSGSGSAYIFKIASDSSVSQIAKIRSDDAQDDDAFASAIAIDGSYIVVGAKGEDEKGAESGSAYLFKIASDDSLTQKAKIVASNGGANDAFGVSVSISGSYIVIGANREDSKAIDAGSAYLFKIQSDESVDELESLYSSSPNANDYFGSSVSIDGEYIVVGAFGVNSSGSASMYHIVDDTTILEVQKLSSEYESDNFGACVSIDNDNVLVGAYKDDLLEEDSGAAYLFQKDINQ